MILSCFCQRDILGEHRTHSTHKQWTEDQDLRRNRKKRKNKENGDWRTSVEQEVVQEGDGGLAQSKPYTHTHIVYS